MSTPHNTAKVGEIAPVCLMPGDPLRAKLIADTYFENMTCFNTVRGMLGYTGTYQGKTVSVMGHGMGMPSVGIYSYELYHTYNVEKIIRIGSAGSIHPSLNLGDVIFAQGASTDSNYASQFKLPGTYAPLASYPLLEKAVTIARAKGTPISVGNVVSSDVFYTPYSEDFEKWQTMGILGVEMECAALYMNAAFAKKEALGILTVSDIIGDHTKVMSTEDRQTKLFAMIEIALETAIS
ncbi:MAG: purine-nucleoside phosphorylase [Eubacteriales bacterium]